jgi:tellurite resistance protein
MSDEFFGDRRRALEESFFAKRNQQLLEQLQEQVAAESQRASLSAASGISDPAVLDVLVSFGVEPATLAALSLVPLVQVAWADGTVEPQERAAILQAAEAEGLDKQDAAFQLLERWLQQPPDKSLLGAWKDYVGALSKKLSEEARQQLHQDVIGRARQVAEAAGGILGLVHKVSAAERAVLAELEKAFS